MGQPPPNSLGCEVTKWDDVSLLSREHHRWEDYLSSWGSQPGCEGGMKGRLLEQAGWELRRGLRQHFGLTSLLGNWGPEKGISCSLRFPSLPGISHSSNRFIKHLLCAKHCPRPWWAKWTKPLLSGNIEPREGDNYFIINAHHGVVTICHQTKILQSYWLYSYS